MFVGFSAVLFKEKFLAYSTPSSILPLSITVRRLDFKYLNLLERLAILVTSRQNFKIYPPTLLKINPMYDLIYFLIIKIGCLSKKDFRLLKKEDKILICTIFTFLIFLLS